jgi:ABC-type multidrug transport system fused ATPase/permease subunit
LVGDIHFENVSFRYGTRLDVFKELNLKINKGEITAIVGESGSGKTTLMTIMQNLYPLNSGKVRLGNYDLSHLSIHSLRNIISVVPQRIDLFSGSIVDNIALGDLNPDLPKILEICKRLGMTKFIEDMPCGLNTHLGENGSSLSGGQQQRIAIARALYRNPEILILDEATSSLDAVAEKFVHSAMRLLREENKTVIVVTHRLSTIKLAERVIVLENGVVVQDGSFSELSAVDGEFRRMWLQQAIEMSGIINTCEFQNHENI